MSQLKNNITAKRMAVLASQGGPLFHIRDLANLWNIQNLKTLRSLLMRYCRSGALHRMYRGFYSLVAPESIDEVLLGAKALHRYCYLTTEAVLYREGYLNQHGIFITFVSDISRTFHLAGHDYKSRQLADRYLYHPEGVFLNASGVREARVERAAADLLYFNPSMHFDRDPDWDRVHHLQQIIGYPLTTSRYASSTT